MSPAELTTAFDFIRSNSRKMKIVNAAGESVSPTPFFPTRTEVTYTVRSMIFQLLSPTYSISLASFMTRKACHPSSPHPLLIRTTRRPAMSKISSFTHFSVGPTGGREWYPR